MRSFVICIFCQVYFKYQVEKDEMSELCNTNGLKKNVYRLLAGKPEGENTMKRKT
jgi:hypothetical protein